MSAGALGGLTSTLAGGAAAPTGGFADLSSEQFIKVLLTEMSNQDPFQPQDSAALLEQLSSLRNIESQLKLQEQIENLVLQNSVTAAAGLIGKEVEGLGPGNDTVSGVVASVRIADGKAVLELSSGKTLSISNVTRIFDLSDRVTSPQ